MPNLATLPEISTNSDTPTVRPSIAFDLAAAGVPLGNRAAAIALIRSR